MSPEELTLDTDSDHEPVPVAEADAPGPDDVRPMAGSVEPAGAESMVAATDVEAGTVPDEGPDDDPAFTGDRPGQATESDWDGGTQYGADEIAVRRPSRAGRRRRRPEEAEPDDSAALAARQAEATAVELRLAHLHLRTGAYDLARIQLETLVGKGRLDERGLIDLAESRWRSGDLTGAADAVDAYLAAGGEAPIAFVIAAEARSAEGRPSDARRFAREAMDRLNLPLDVLFAGQPRSSVWPHDPAHPSPTTGTLFAAGAASAMQGGRIGVSERPVPPSTRAGTDPATAAGAPSDGVIESANQAGEGFWDDDQGTAGDLAGLAANGATAGSRDPAALAVDPAGAVPAPAPGSATPAGTVAPEAATKSGATGADDALIAGGYEPPEPTWLLVGEARASTPDAHVELERARDALRDRDLHAAAMRLAMALRLRPSLAPIVLDLAGDLPGSEFDLLRGDALRLVGRESAAQQAYASAMSADRPVTTSIHQPGQPEEFP